MALSRENNAKRGVTGMLLYKEGNFIQVLEGDEREVRIVFTKRSARTLGTKTISSCYKVL
jgi:hypothetical protein